MICHVCHSASLTLIDGVAGLPGVTSDCRPWKGGTKLAVCGACGVVQKLVDAEWRKEVSDIYASYAIYHQSATAAEQPVFNQQSGQPMPRSRRILNGMLEYLALPDSGSMVDIGCGNGAMLRAFSDRFPDWDLYGVEPNCKDDGWSSQLPRLKRLISGYLGDTEGIYDFATLIHVLEHVDDPVAALKRLRQNIAPDGKLGIQVPGFLDNPVELMVVDHVTHFTPEHLAQTLCAGGFAVPWISTTCVRNEITAVCSNGTGDHQPPAALFNPRPDSLLLAQRSVTWLHQVLDMVRNLANRPKFGIFGTAIFANWILADLGDQIDFFVDEAPERAGRTYHGRPVYAPADVPDDSDVFLALSIELAKSVGERCARPGLRYHQPPAFTSS